MRETPEEIAEKIALGLGKHSGGGGGLWITPEQLAELH